MGKILKIKVSVSNKKDKMETTIVSFNIEKETNKKLHLSFIDRFGDEDKRIIAKERLGEVELSDYHTLGVVSAHMLIEEEKKEEAEKSVQKELVNYLKGKRDAYNNLLNRM